jgi:hypothetical protein
LVGVAVPLGGFFLVRIILGILFVAEAQMFEPKLLERAEIAAKQMRYFRLFSQKGSFGELSASAQRAGFKVTYEDAVEKEAGFQWSSEGDPDFTFLVSFRDPEAVTVTAEAHRDLFGLVMTSLSNVPKISIEAIAEHELGRNAHDFQKIILTFPDFDGGFQDLLGRLGI